MEILKFLAQVASKVEQSGFVSVKDAKVKNAMSTGEDSAWALIDGQPSFTETHTAIAERALAYVRGYEGDNSFLKSLQTAAAFDEIGMGQADKVAWVIPVYQRATQEATPVGFGADSEFVGEIGEEVCFRGVVAMARSVGTRFGPKQIITLTDKANNVFTYWPSNRVLALVAGNEVRVRGTVKAHSVYNGINQTQLTRAKIVASPTAAV